MSNLPPQHGTLRCRSWLLGIPRGASRLERLLATCVGILWLGSALVTSSVGQESVAPAGGEPREAVITAQAERRIQSKLMAPCCWNGTIDNHDSRVTSEMRAEIHDRLARGESAEAILAHFVEVYGPQVLAEPPARGLNVLVYILPALAFLAGGFWLARYLKHQLTVRVAIPGQVAAPPPDVSRGRLAPADQYVERVERALARLDD